MDNKLQKSDPIRSKYFLPLEHAEKAGGVLFILTALLSTTILFIDSSKYPDPYTFVQIIFVVFVTIFSFNEIFVRLYLSPRAQSKRFQDFLSHAYQDKLVPLVTDNYYTTKGTTPPIRMAYQLLENSHYSTDTITQMVRIERAKIVIYFIIWLLIILNRSSELDLIVVIAQVLFSEQIISRWLRMEWLRYQFESVHEGIYRAVKSNCDMELLTLELLCKYETAKANAGITLSSKIFKKREKVTDVEWSSISNNIGI